MKAGEKQRRREAERAVSLLRSPLEQLAREILYRIDWRAYVPTADDRLILKLASSGSRLPGRPKKRGDELAFLMPNDRLLVLDAIGSVRRAFELARPHKPSTPCDRVYWRLRRRKSKREPEAIDILTERLIEIGVRFFDRTGQLRRSELSRREAEEKARHLLEQHSERVAPYVQAWAETDRPEPPAALLRPPPLRT